MTVAEIHDFYKEIFEDLNEGFQVISPDWTYYYVNKEVLKQSRKSKEELIGKKMMDVFPGIEKTPMFAMLYKCMREKCFDKMINKFDYPDGNTKWFELSIEPVPQGLIIMTVEITMYKKAEEHINKLNRLYKVLSNINHSIVRIRNSEDLLKKTCQIAVELGEFMIAWIGVPNHNTGELVEIAYSGPERKTGASIVINQSDPEFTDYPAIKVLKSGAPVIDNQAESFIIDYNWENKLLPDGKYSVVSYPLKLHENIWGVITIYAENSNFFDHQELNLIDEIVLDLSFALEVADKEQDRVKNISENQKLTEYLNKNQRLQSLGMISGGIAHDFNNLLSGIFGFIDMAKISSSGNKEVEEYLDEALNIMNRATSLTNQLLTFSKDEVPIRKTASLIKLLEKSVNFALSGSNVSVEYKIDKNLMLADFDENQVGQVIDNIVINAKQAMENGGKLIVKAENTGSENIPFEQKANKYIKISITDKGSGIPKDILPNIFDPFFTTKPNGNGIGLTTCFSIIKKHGGYIDVKSAPGKGSTFEIYLPASEKSIVETNLVEESFHKGTGRVLIMDDKDYIRNILSKMLNSMGYEVTTASNGYEAIEIFIDAQMSGNPFSVVFLDLTVQGGMGGKDAITELRNFNISIPIFASSGYKENIEMENPGSFGFTDSIQKPFRMADLVTLMNKYCKK
jgi:PAS domain S-box-containing protein